MCGLRLGQDDHLRQPGGVPEEARHARRGGPAKAGGDRSPETVVETVNAEITTGPLRGSTAKRKAAEYGKAVGVAVKVCQNALSEARKVGVDTLILDTAGRPHINDGADDRRGR